MTDATPSPVDPKLTWRQQSFRHDRQLTRCRFSGCGKAVVAAGLDGALQSWRLDTGERSVLGRHENWIGDLAVHPSESLLYSCDYDGDIHCRRVEVGSREPARTLWTIEAAHRGWARGLAIDPDGRLLASCGDDGAVRLWSARSGKLEREWRDHDAHVLSLAFHPSGERLVSGDLLGIVRDRDCRTGAVVRVLDASGIHTREDRFLADVGGARSLVFDSRGERLAASGLANAKSNTFCPGQPTALLFDWRSGELRRTLRVSAKADGPLNAVRFLDDSLLAGVAEGASGGTVGFWRPDDGAQVHAVSGSSGYDIDVHPDGRRVAVALYLSHGRSGNGRHVERDKYFGNAGSVEILALYAEPPSAPKSAKKT